MDKKAFLTKWLVVSILLLIAYHAHHRPIKIPTLPYYKDKRIEQQARQILAAPPGAFYDIDEDIEEDVRRRVYYHLERKARKERKKREEEQKKAWNIYRATELNQNNVNQ